MLQVIRSAYNYDRDEASRLSGLLCEDDSLAVQSEKEECDINTLVKRFGITGQLPQGVRMPTYGDFTEVLDFRTAHDALIAARQSFMALPADVRKRFSNDPAEFVDFCSNPQNLEECRKMGLAPAAGPPPKADVPEGEVVK